MDIRQEIDTTQRKLELLQELQDIEESERGNSDFSNFNNRGGNRNNQNITDRNSNRGYGNRNTASGNTNSRQFGGRNKMSGDDHGLRNMDGTVDERQFNSGRRNFADSNDTSDDRTEAGRVAHDAEEFTQDQLIQMLNNPENTWLNEDGTFDRRTKPGRALYAAGMIDDDGNPDPQYINQGRGRNRPVRSGRSD